MSSSTLIKSFSLSSALKMDQQEINYKKQGIVSILGFDTEKEAKSTSSLRRTISADMSSRKWLEQNSLASSPIKKVASSEEFKKVCMEEEEDDDKPSLEDLEKPDQSEVWNSIQEANKKKVLNIKKQPTFDWESILTQKDDSPKASSPPPYVHPLVNKSASSLSKKSLEVCTESLGSETGSEQTGSDGFSYSPPSKTEDGKEQENHVQLQVKQEKVSPKLDKENVPLVKFHYADRKKIQPRSFPPPLPSLSQGVGGSNGASLQMRPRRNNGRLVLEAVTVPSQNTFHAQRQDGRLVLSIADTSSYEDDSMNQETTTDEDQLKDAKELEEIFPDFELDEEIELDSDEEDEAGEETEMDKTENFKNDITPMWSNDMVNVHRSLLMASKPMALVKRRPTWTNKYNEEVAKSLPPRHPGSILMIPKPQVATAVAAASLNAYENYWQDKHILHVQETSPLEEKNSSKFIVSKNLVANEQQQLQVLRGSSADRLVPLTKGCKETRRSLLFLEPHCIATS